MSRRRKYELKKRAEQVAETRRRIVEATVELHRTVGPAATEISEVARRAGVQRVTVYNHFPDHASLLAACSGHWRALHPAPDPTRWRATPGPDERLHAGLLALYAWYRETEPMTAHVLRDAEVVPELRSIIDAGFGTYLETVRGILAKPFGARGRRRARVAAAVAAATDFHFWRSLAPLGDADAAALAAAFVGVAAQEPPRRRAADGGGQSASRRSAPAPR